MGGGSETDSHSTTTTELPQWVQDAGQSNYNVAKGLASAPNPYYQGNATAGLTSATYGAMGNAFGNMNNTDNLMTGLNGNIDAYNPSISASPVGSVAQAVGNGYNAATYTGQGYTGQGYTASTAAPSGMVTAGQLANTNLSPYMNPYVDDVVSKSMTQLNQQAALTANNNAAKAASAGAFGGTRAAVQQGVADAQTAQNAGLISSQLYSQGYDNAQNAAVGDINRRLQADTTNVANANNINEFNANSLNNAGSFNASAANAANAFTANANNSANSQNASAMNSAGQFSAAAGNTASMANAAATNSMAQYNSSQNLAAKEAQDAAVRATYGLQMSGAQQQSTLNNQNATTLGQFGAAQQATNQAKLTSQIAQYNQNAAYPQQQLGLLESALGMTPYNTTTQSDGTVTKSQSPDFASIGLGAMKMFNPFSSFM